MAIQLNDNLNILVAKSVDQRYGPYLTPDAANTAIPSSYRYKGLVVGIYENGSVNDKVVEYWYESGVTNSNLVIKSGGAGSAGATGVTGATGAAGATGVAGATGLQGATGPAGVDGSPGLNGLDGLDGATGPSGAQGATGVQGATGEIGLTGATGLTGLGFRIFTTVEDNTLLPSNPTGLVGEFVLVKGGELYVYAGTGLGSTGPDNKYTLVGDLTDETKLYGSTGPIGPTGSSGLQGATGITGATGETGATGPAGVDGAPGPAGADGADGLDGLDGATGPSGAQGATGETGLTGATGVAGSTGPSGAEGATGPSGTQGNAGATGATGEVGATGLTGATGASGISDRYQTSSNSSLALVVGTGKTLTVETGLSYTANQTILVTLTSDTVKYAAATVTGYEKSSGLLTFTIDNVYGSPGTDPLQGFTVNLSGAVGVVGATGVAGPSGATGPAGDGGTSLYNTAINDAVTNVQVGGASSGTAASVWKTKTLIEVFDAILFPDLNPTYTVPTIVLTENLSSTVYEVGVTLNNTAFTVTATENDAGVFTNLTVKRGSTSLQSWNNPTGTNTTDVLALYGYASPNNPNKIYTQTHTYNHVVTLGTTTWTATGDYNAGEAKKNNKGVTDTRSAALRTTTAPQSAATAFSSAAFSITGLYPYFFGTSSTALTTNDVKTLIESGSGTKRAESSTGDVTVAYNADQVYFWFATPDSSPPKTVAYVNELNKPPINTTDPLNTWYGPGEATVDSPSSLWAGVNYKIYYTRFKTQYASLTFKN